MAVLEIVKYPSELLKRKLSSVERFDSDLKHIVRDMFETMYAFSGVGLAANQVGLDKRIIVVDMRSIGKKLPPLALINPEIINQSERAEVMEEGCLSFPGYYDKVSRAEAIEVKFYDITGKKRTISAYGLFARVLQHEIDHINGISFIQRMSFLRQVKFYTLHFFGKHRFNKHTTIHTL